MRFLTLILSVFFVPSLYAEENWTSVVSPANDTGMAGAFRDVERTTPRIIDGEEAITPSFVIYFQPKYMCYPVFYIAADEETTSLQLRVDEREVYRPPQLKWQNETRGIWFSFFEPSDNNVEKAMEQLKVGISLLADLREGTNVRAKLEPSGKVMLWRLRGSAKAIQDAAKRCGEGLENQQFFPE